MFDILVDTPKKRVYGVAIVLLFSLSIVLLLDLMFGFEVLKAPSFNQLLQLHTQSQRGFLAYFFNSCLSSGAAYLSFSFSTVLTYLSLIAKSFSFWDWLLMSGLWFFILSHHSHISKIMLCVLGAYFGGRLLLLGGIVAYLLQVLATNNAAAILNGIQLASIMLVFIHVLALVANLVFLVKVVKNEYLRLF